MSWTGMKQDRTMISFFDGTRRLNCRTAAIIIENNHLLVCREDSDDFVLLPGGRVEFGEASAIALEREIEEELKHQGKLDSLVFSVENFFVREDVEFHEMAYYYRATLPTHFPFVQNEPCLVTHDEGHELSFYWIETSPEALKAINLLPAWLRDTAQNLPDVPTHVVFDER